VQAYLKTAGAGSGQQRWNAHQVLIRVGVGIIETGRLLEAAKTSLSYARGDSFQRHFLESIIEILA